MKIMRKSRRPSKQRNDDTSPIPTTSTTTLCLSPASMSAISFKLGHYDFRRMYYYESGLGTDPGYLADMSHED